MTNEKVLPIPMKNENAGMELTVEVGNNCVSVKIFNKAKNVYVSNGPVVLNDLSTVGVAINQIFSLLLEQKKEQTNEPKPKTNIKKVPNLKYKKKG